MYRILPLASTCLFISTIIILGFITPGYNHFSHTISRLAIMKYGGIQTLNLLQFALGMYLGGRYIADTMKTREAKRVILNIFFFCSGILVLTAATQTDPIENLQMDPRLLSPMGLTHYIVILLFLVAAPFGIRKMTTVLSNEPHFSKYVSFTRTMGAFALTASILWFVFFFYGIFLEYRGLFQKVIVLWTISWIIIMNLVAYRLSSTERV